MGNRLGSRVPFIRDVGVDNRFGWLDLPDGRSLLVEPILFHETTSVVVDLDHGDRHIVAADGTGISRALDAAEACAIAGIPEPRTEEWAEVTIRLDPFHIENHTSPRFRAIVDTVCRRTLPCGAVVAEYGAAPTDAPFELRIETAEMFAASVSERIARTGDDIVGAIRNELAADLEATGAEMPVDEFLDQTGWADALNDTLDGALAHYMATLADARNHRHQPAEPDDQLILL
jgi:hypothetical protein